MTLTLSAGLRAIAAYPLYVARDIAEAWDTVARYYRNAQFRRADLLCRWAYLMRDPYAICQQFLRSQSDDRVQKVYGETFLTTFEAIAKAVQLNANDVVYDLGCGRGRGVFWLNAMYRCRAVGVDVNPLFVIQARLIQKYAQQEGVEFILANVMDIDYDDATVIYLYGTAFSDEAVVKLIDCFAKLKPGTRIVTVSYALSEYTSEPLFELEQTIPARFVWGSTDLYVQRKL